jgi:glutamate synthase (ferredoxin)
MSGGIAYVFDAAGDFAARCNQGMVDLEPLDEIEDVLVVQDLIERHIAHTGSDFAALIQADWEVSRERFVKVMPRDYRRVLRAGALAEAEGRRPTFHEMVGATSG